jgi:antitoxin component YwqK of YwqJK toxin-antitoxin module
MKNIGLLLLLLLFFTTTFSQEDKNKKIEKVGDFYEVTIYYDNGTIMQHGFLTKDNKLHASWESYYQDGTKKCVATYNEGEKVGNWIYWNNGKRTMVTYENNAITAVVKLDSIQ